MPHLKQMDTPVRKIILIRKPVSFFSRRDNSYKKLQPSLGVFFLQGIMFHIRKLSGRIDIYKGKHSNLKAFAILLKRSY